nr:hypothetical protein [Natronorubrum texcoconense]
MTEFVRHELEVPLCGGQRGTKIVRENVGEPFEAFVLSLEFEFGAFPARDIDRDADHFGHFPRATLERENTSFDPPNLAIRSDDTKLFLDGLPVQDALISARHHLRDQIIIVRVSGLGNDGQILPHIFDGTPVDLFERGTQVIDAGRVSRPDDDALKPIDELVKISTFRQLLLKRLWHMARYCTPLGIALAG